MGNSDTMTPKEAVDLLFAMSSIELANKQRHMKCEQAKAILDVALKRLQDLVNDARAARGVE